MIELCEDYFESPVFLIHETAKYGPSDGQGHLYVFSKDRIEGHDIKAFNLSSINIRGTTPRFHKQKAWLIGPLRDELPSDTTLAHIYGDGAVFAELSSEAGFNDTATLFPDEQEDALLKILVSLPWKIVERSEDGDEGLKIPFFRQSIEIPNYHFKGQKRLPPTVALFTGNRLSDEQDRDERLKELCFFQMPDGSFFGKTERSTHPIPNASAVISRFKKVVLEIDEIIRMPEFEDQTSYAKGMYIERIDDETAWIGELVIDQVGLRPSGFGVNMGWHYKIDSIGTWTRFLHPGDCPCNNSFRHERLYSVLLVFDILLEEKAFLQVAERRFLSKNIGPWI